MKRHITILFLFCVVPLTFGCGTSKRGLIELETRPPGATVYLNQIEQGMTLVTFEYDLRIPAQLEIEKDGYQTGLESLDGTWIVEEYRKGNYTEGHFSILGKERKAWKIKTIRILQKEGEQKELPRREIINKEKESNETIETIEALRKYKELLDEGVITQEDFEKKKRELMDLD